MSPILECKNLIKNYGDTPAVNGLDLTVEPGRIVGLFGPKGSGKTTLLKLAAGLLTPNGGELLIDGKTPGAETKRITAFLPDKDGFDERDSVAGILRVYRDFYADFDERKALAMLSDLGVEPKNKLADLSKGSVQKLRLSLTVSRAAKLYLLDDPVKSVDTATLSYVLDSIVSGRPDNSSVIITSQTPSDVERIIQDAAFISAGRITRYADAEKMRADNGKSVHALYTEEFKC